jgi:hypothetical protein
MIGLVSLAAFVFGLLDRNSDAPLLHPTISATMCWVGGIVTTILLLAAMAAVSEKRK